MFQSVGPGLDPWTTEGPGGRVRMQREGRKDEGREGKGEEKLSGRPFPPAQDSLRVTHPHCRLFINLSEYKHSNYSLWLLVKTM